MSALEETASSGSRAQLAGGAATYAKLSVSGALAPFVRHIRLVPPTQHEGRYVRLPDGQMELVLRSRGGSAHDWLNVVGTRSHALRKESGPTDAFCVVVRFHAGGGYPFFGIPVSELTNQLVGLDQLWGSLFQHLRDVLAHADDAHACLAATQQALRARLAGPELYDPANGARVRRALRVLEQETVLPAVETLAERLGASTRQLRRAFAEVVGLSPKQYLRIMRFQRARGLMRAGAEPRWSMIAQTAGYFDQAHMINEFRVLSGQTPGELWSQQAHALRAPKRRG
jgi:AraC-like DNA-binding protein